MRGQIEAGKTAASAEDYWCPWWHGLFSMLWWTGGTVASAYFAGYLEATRGLENWKASLFMFLLIAAFLRTGLAFFNAEERIFRLQGEINSRKSRLVESVDYPDPTASP